jgi:hypothetical protein
MELSAAMGCGFPLGAWRHRVARRLFSLAIALIFTTRAVTIS